MARLVHVASCILALLPAMSAAARPSLVCRITARVPFSSTRIPGVDSTRVFVQTANVLEERPSGTSLTYLWTVITDTPDQLRAIDPVRSLILTVGRPGGAFAESGVKVQRRGYCWLNDLP